ncbi:MAG: hypothetical protein AAF399_01650 [Bacteroidota bacterium]
MPPIRLLIVVLCFLLVATACISPDSSNQAKEDSPAIFSANFADAQATADWVRSDLQGNAAGDTISTFPNGLLRLQGKRVIKSPRFAVEELQYYQLDFEAATTHRAMWALVFWDKNGKMLLADIYSSIDPGEDLRQHRFLAQSKADAAFAQFWLQNGEEAAETRLSRISISLMGDPSTYMAWADSIYAGMPPLGELAAPPNRDQIIPRTLAALRSGQSIRIVMLGNSIINDTGNSGWELPVEAAYPGANIEVITSVRGGTGCWYYQEDNRVDTFVNRYQPDLLIIGGISHRKDTAAIHNVIRQVRAKSNPEILVLSGPVGRQGDPRSDSTFTFPPVGEDFRLQLASMAQDASVGYIDMKTDWGSYIQSSGKPYAYFLRDPVHANARGRQVLARLMYAYFQP